MATRTLPAKVARSKGARGGKGTRKGRGDTRGRIVLAAAELIHRQGVNATSLDMVARAAGVNRGSLYYFFRSKKNLARAVIDHFEGLLATHYLKPALEGEGGGREKIERLAGLYSQMPRLEAPCCGCPIGNLSLEVSGQDEELRVQLAGVWERIFGRIEGALRQARDEGELPPGADAGALARAFFSQIQGAHIIARATLDAAALQRDCRRAFEGLPWIFPTAGIGTDESAPGVRKE